MAKIDIVSNEWSDIVFADRNQAYGAYQLRQGTSKRNVISIISVLVIAILVYVGTLAKTAIDQAIANRLSSTAVTEISQIEEPKKEAEVKQEIKIEEPEQVVEKVKSSIKFDVPEIKEDDQVKEDEQLKTQDELMNTNTAIGAFDVEGNDEENGEVLKATETIAQPEPPKEDVQKVFDVVEEMPSFTGGNGALMQWLNENVKYPVVAQENGVSGRVIVSFVVERDGSITDVQVVRSVDPALDKEAARAVKSMPKWIPGKQNGQAVRVKYNVPVLFRLQ
ncbi:MAG: energy transducer TonB [Prevotella sp.]|nr:energy transducer TonB [Prevotella sp.]